MLQVTPQMRILVAIEPADFRKGIDGMAQLCRAELATDPSLCVARKYVAPSRQARPSR
jgi:hypothetical protein